MKNPATIKADAYAKKYFALLQATKMDYDVIDLINKIYQDGFEDGYNETENLTNGNIE